MISWVMTVKKGGFTMDKKHAGGRPRKLTPLEERAIVRQYAKGVNITELAYKNGISESTLFRILRKAKASA